jgi:hypothetical protein
LARNDGKLQIAEEEIHELEHMAIESIHNERLGEREFYKMSRAS